MEALRISLFGRMEIRRDGGDLVAMPTRARELLSYLLLNRNQPQSRECLACALWDEALGCLAKKYLRQSLWQLHKLLGPGELLSPPLLIQFEQDWLGIHPDAPIWVDVERFDDACRRVRDVPGAELDPALAAAVYAASDLYRAELLSGCYRDWCLVDRERLQSLFLSLLDKLVDFCAAQNRFEEGIAHAMRALRIEPTRETTHRRLMRLHAGAGDRSAAMRQFGLCQAALRREFNVEPSAQTRALSVRIANDPIPIPGHATRPYLADGLPHCEPVSHPFRSVTDVGTASAECSERLDRALRDP